MERLKNIAVVVGLILSFITLYNWGARFFAHDVVAQLEAGAFELPPQLESFYSKLATTVNGDALVARSRANESLKDAYFLKDFSDDQKESLVRQFAGLLPRESEVTLPYDFKQIEAYWRGTITNSSKARVTTVQLYLSGAKY